MAIATAAAITSMAATAASTGMSISQASKARKSQREAEREAERITEETKRMMDFNPFEAVAIQKEPYELMAESIVEGAAREAELLAEADPRYLAGMAGARGQQQQDQLEKVRAAMSRELQGLEITTAQEEANIRNNLQKFAQAEITGAQQAAAEQERIAGQATISAIQGFGSLAGQAAEFAPLYSKGGAKKQLSEIGPKAESVASDIRGTYADLKPIMGGGYEVNFGDDKKPLAIDPFQISPGQAAPTLSKTQSKSVKDLGGRYTALGYLNTLSNLEKSGNVAGYRDYRKALEEAGLLEKVQLLAETFNK